MAIVFCQIIITTMLPDHCLLGEDAGLKSSLLFNKTNKLKLYFIAVSNTQNVDDDAEEGTGTTSTKFMGVLLGKRGGHTVNQHVI